MAGTPSDLTMSDIKRWTTNWHNFKVSYVAEKATGDIIWQPTGKTYREMPYIDWSYVSYNNAETFMGTGTISISIPTTNVAKYEITFAIPDSSKYQAGTSYVYPIISGYNSIIGSNQRFNVYIGLRYYSTGWKFIYYNYSTNTSFGGLNTISTTPQFAINNTYKIVIFPSTNSTAATVKLYDNTDTLLTTYTLYKPNEWLIIGGIPSTSTGYPVIYNNIRPAKSIAVFSVKTYDSNNTLIADGRATEHKTDYTIDFVNISILGTWLVKNNATTQYMNLPQYTGTSVENPSWSGDIRMHANVSDL